MTHPSHWARVAPDRVALSMSASGATLTYAELDAASNRVAHLLRARGLATGDSIVIVMANGLDFMPICWAAQRSGLYFTPASTRLLVDELTYILTNSGAKALFVDPGHAAVAAEAAARAGIAHRFVVGGKAEGFEPYEQAVAAMPATPIADQSAGREMLYSSGTTGLPKGVKNVVLDADLGTIPPAMAWLTAEYGFDESTVNVTPAPLYHAGPLRYSLCVGHTGGTNIVMEKFDAEEMLRLIAQHRVTHVEAVPTMFVRLLRLPAEVRARYDLSSLRYMVHGSAPCAPDTKRAMIDWLGPILYEQYGGTEGNGLCGIRSDEWLARPGSVGRAVIGAVHIVGDDGRDLPAGEQGLVYFEGGPRFGYHQDDEKTKGAYSPEGWSTLGDVGYLDADGYLFLTDRQSHMIVTGGVNVYPQEAENILLAHPRVLDAAVFGVPDPEYGERVIAVVHPVDMAEAGPDLAAVLIDYCRSRIADLKCPRAIDFSDALPRHDTGKIYKRLLKQTYAERATAAAA